MSDDDQGGPEEPTPAQLAEIEALLGSIVREFKARNATQTEAPSDADGSTENVEAPDAEVFDLAAERRKRQFARGEMPTDLHAALNDMFTKVFGTPLPPDALDGEVFLNEDYLRQHAPEMLAGALRNLAHAMDTAAEKKGKQKKSAPSSPASRRGTPVKFRVDLGSLINRLFTPKD